MKSLSVISILCLLWKVLCSEEKSRDFLAQSTFTCDPAADCSNLGYAGASVPDPNDCERYYICIELTSGEIVPSTSSVKCPDGSYFDHYSQSCILETTPGVCYNLCQKTCVTQCPSYDGIITLAAYKNNCSLYQVCLPNGAALTSCTSDTPYFNGENCVADRVQCCNFCTPYCSTTGTQIQDPCDCTSYYICFELGIPNDNWRLSCGSGTYYDETTASCVSGVCNSLCSRAQCGEPYSCAPYCSVIGSQIQDPCDCTSYYVCIEVGEPSGNLRFSCGSGTYYDETTASCVSGVCNSVCSSSQCGYPSGCTSLESFTCPSRDGNFPRCTYCDKSFFHCSNNVPDIAECMGITVFNPNNNCPGCIDPLSCPNNCL